MSKATNRLLQLESKQSKLQADLVSVKAEIKTVKATIAVEKKASKKK
jgi:hypothetical protein